MIGTLEAVLTSPISPGTVQVGSVVFDLAFIPLRLGALLIAVAFAFGAGFEASGLLPSLTVMVAFLPFRWGLGLLTGAVIVTFPLMLVAYFQWGFGTEWLWIMGAYFIIQGFDANILVPLLYSEVVDLHPIAIIAAVLFFGGVWGLWGVFFSIPLATLVQAVIKAWPSPELPVVTASIPDQR